MGCCSSSHEDDGPPASLCHQIMVPQGVPAGGTFLATVAGIPNVGLVVPPEHEIGTPLELEPGYLEGDALENDNQTYQVTGRTIEADGVTIMGNFNRVEGDRCTVQGSFNHVEGDRNKVIGAMNVVEGDHNMVAA